MKIVIVGGGTSGWITLAYLAATTDLELVIIHSEEIDTLGVGESTTPTIQHVAETCGIDENTWMNKIYTCVCTAVDINYTPNQFQTLRSVPNRGGAPMAEMEMKLDFMETKLVTKEDILEGY